IVFCGATRRRSNSANTLGLGLPVRGVLLQKIDDLARYVDAGGTLDTFEAWRRVDLHDQRPVAGAHHVDAADVEAKGRRGARGNLALLVGQLHLHSGAPAMQVGAELARAADAFGRRDNFSSNDERADVAAIRLADELLNHNVDIGGAERLDDRLRRALGLSEDHAHALSAFEELDDDGNAADFLDDVLGFARPVRDDWHSLLRHL